MTTHSSLKITISKEYIDDLNLRSWLNIELPASFPETDNPIPAFEEALSKVKQMYSIAEGKAASTKEEKIPTNWVEAINTCKDLKTLEIYKPMIKDNLRAQKFYKQKLNELTNAH